MLKDPQKRAAYDRFGKAAFQNGGGADPFGDAGFNGFSDIFSTIFGDFMDQRGQQQNAARGADLRYDIQLSLEEAFSGVDKDDHGRGACHAVRPATAAAAPARTSAPATCSTCGGMGKVRAQQGFFVVERGCPTCRGSGEVISDPCANCQGEGRALEQRQPVGENPARRRRRHAHPHCRRGRSRRSRRIERRSVPVRAHEAAPDLRREGTTLVADCPVTFTTAALGGTITLPGIDGEKLDLKIPPGVQSGEQLRHRGSGMSVLNGRGRGDLVARILVETPTRMSSQAEEDARGIPRDGNRRGMPGVEELFQPRPRHVRRLVGRLAPARSRRSARTAPSRHAARSDGVRAHLALAA